MPESVTLMASKSCIEEDDLAKKMAALKVSRAEREVDFGAKVDGEDELIESVSVQREGQEENVNDAESCYATKGPSQLRRLLEGRRSSPYKDNGARRTLNQLNVDRSNEEEQRRNVSNSPRPNLEQRAATPIPSGSSGSIAAVGQFIDDPIELANILLESKHCPSPEGGEEVEPKAGIPALPDTTSMTKNKVGLPRIIVRGKPDSNGKRDSSVVLPTPLSLFVDPRLRKIGVWLPRQSLPARAVPLITNAELEILIQLDVEVPRIIRHVAAVGQGEVAAHIVSQFVELCPFVSTVGTLTGVAGLLEDVEEGEIEAALNLVNGKDLTDLLKTYGPNQDSMLMTLCCKRDEPPTIRAQVFALVSRILSQEAPKARSNVVQKNACHLSALDYTTVMNNRRIACFLAELYYVMGEDVACPDGSGNTLLHMMARNGDASASTLWALLGLRYASDATRRVYNGEARNNRLYTPLHFAAMSRRCPQVVIQLLQEDSPSCSTANTEDESTPVHLACQYASDPTMLATLLRHDGSVVNLGRSDGFTPLHLVASRNDAEDREIGLIPLDKETQLRMICLLLDHGADRSCKVEGKYVPCDLVKVDRIRARAMLKVPHQMHSSQLKALLVNYDDPFLAAYGWNDLRGGGGGGHCFQQRMSPGTLCSLTGNQSPFQSARSGSTSDASANSDGGCDSGGEADLMLNNENHLEGRATASPFVSELADGELDFFARAFYHHPTIQAVINETEAND